MGQMAPPLVHYGDSACVFKLATSEGDVAVRCFTRQLTGLQARYASLADYLRGGGSDSLVGFEYIEQGIRVEGDWFPIVRMDWAEGSRLDGFVAEHIDEPGALLDLAARWRSAVASIRRLGIAHNDLEPGNVIVSEQGPLRLVDYDSMFIPDFDGEESPEPGHRNYRHPIRIPGTTMQTSTTFRRWSFTSACLLLPRIPTFGGHSTMRIISSSPGRTSQTRPGPGACRH